MVSLIPFLIGVNWKSILFFWINSISLVLSAVFLNCPSAPEVSYSIDMPNLSAIIWATYPIEYSVVGARMIGSVEL